MRTLDVSQGDTKVETSGDPTIRNPGYLLLIIKRTGTPHFGEGKKRLVKGGHPHWKSNIHSDVQAFRRFLV